MNYGGWTSWSEWNLLPVLKVSKIGFCGEYASWSIMIAWGPFTGWAETK